MQIEHLNKETTDGTVRNLDALHQLFPSCFTEAKDAVTGKMRRVVDWGKLRELLGEYVETDEPEKYDFTWVGKRAAQREAAAPSWSHFLIVMTLKDELQREFYLTMAVLADGS